MLKRHRIFQLFTTRLFLVLAAGSIIEGNKMTGFSASIPAGKSLHPFLTGIFLSATNSLHIPSRLGWCSVLLNKKIMLPYSNHYNWYIAGFAAGAILGFMVFICGDNYMAKKIT
jgi:hypothetical protein